MIISILYGLLIIAIIFLIIKLIQLIAGAIRILKNFNKVLVDNKRSIDITILETSKNLEQTADLLKTINMKERELREIMDNIDTISTNLANVTTTVSDTIQKGEKIVTGASKAASAFDDIFKVFKKEKNGK